jgi:putative acetyltransferase
VSLANPRSDECLLLSDHSWSELNGLYGDVDRAEFSALDFSGAGSAFVVARHDGRAVGCGAIRPLAPGVAEVKRIFVEPEARQRGIGRKILSALETIGRDLGYNALQLETGLRQPAAIRLYGGAGYNRIAAYGRYRGDPMSICYEKIIARNTEMKQVRPLAL